MDSASLASSEPLATPASPALLRRWTLAFGLHTALSNAAFGRAIWLVYLAAHGYSPFEIGIAEMVFHLAKFIAEVPTGVFADLVGRRASLIAASILGAVAELTFLRPVLPVTIVGFALMGTAFAFRGGANEALLWGIAGHVEERQRAARYSRLLSLMLLILLISEALASALGGVLGRGGVALPFVLHGLAIGLSVLPLFALPEQRVAASHRVAPLPHVRAGLRAVRAQPVLLGLLLLSGLEASIWTTVNMYTQLYFAGLGFSLATIGVLFGISSIVDAGSTALAPRLIRRVRWPVLLALLVGGQVLGLLALVLEQPVLAIAGFIGLFHVTDAVFVPAMSTYINMRSPEAQRATVLSLETGLFSLAMIVVFPLVGWAFTRMPFTTVYLGAALVLVLGTAAILALVWRLRRATQTAVPDAPVPNTILT